MLRQILKNRWPRLGTQS